MATIQTTISLRDNMSSKVDKITSSINRMTAASQRAQNNVAKMSLGFNNMGNSVNRTTNSVSTLGSTLKNIGLVVIAQQTAEAFIKASDAIISAQAKLNLLEGSAEKGAMSMDNIYLAAQRSRAEYTGFAKSVGKLGTLAGKSFGDTNEIIGFVELMNKLYTVSGASAREASSTMYQLTQSLAKGVLNGDELRSVMEGAPMLAQAIADNLGVSVGKMKDLAAQGKVTTQVVKESLYGIQDKLNDAFGKTPLTFEKAMQNVKNSLIKAFEPAMKAFNRLINDEDFQKFAKGVESTLFSVGEAFAKVFDLIGRMAKIAIWAWDFLKPVILTVAAFTVSYVSTLIILKIVSFAARAAQIALGVAQMIGAIATGILTRATWAEIQAKLAATAAQWGLNAAIYACPIFWIILAIIALIAVVYLAVAAINHFAGTSISATGIVAGTFMVLYGIIYNIIVYLYNYWLSFAEFFTNFMKNPTYSMKKLIVNLATNVLDAAIAMTKGWDKFATSMYNAFIDAVNGIIDAWNWLMDLLPDEVKATLDLGKGTKFTHSESITSDLESFKGELQSLVADKPDDYKEFSRLEYKNLGDMWNKGYEWGKGVDEAASNFFNQDALRNSVDELMQNKGGVYDPVEDKIKKNTGKTAKNTDKLADYGEEDLKYLRDIAERDAINRFTTAKINVNMNNNNSISSNMDLDGVVNYLTEKTKEALAATAARAY